uniref:non-specific protein-tyrosine kinase n=1 Tax=Roseihalotalea indica TaxID=2867963 RepID=A0AA49GM10_9BACT|nr:polysaccharide biosynthesis tyrosine autokinase [Tunicatimonas sp. TK19036]
MDKAKNINNQNQTIDIFALLGKMVRRWYFFAISLAITISIALIYVMFAEQKYEVGSTIYLKSKDSGSEETTDLLNNSPKDGPSGIALTNEIGKLSSYSLIKSALERLDFGITYYNVESFWPGFMREDWLNETYSSFPYEIKIDSSQLQLVNVPIFIEAISETEYKVTAKNDEVNAVAFADNGGRKVFDYDFEGVGEFGKPFASDIINITVDKKGGNESPDLDYAFKVTRLEDLAMQYQGKLNIQPFDEMDAENRMLKLSIKSSIDGKGMQFLNSVIDVYAAEGLSKKNNRGSNSVEFLDKEIARVTDSLKQAELALETFKASSGILNMDAAIGTSVEGLNALQNNKAEAEQKIEYYKSTLAYLESNDDYNKIIAPSSAGINEDPLFNKLIENYINLVTRLNNAGFNAQPNNPLYIRIKQEVENTRSAIREQLKSALASQQRNLVSINQRIGNIRYSMNQLPQDERKLQILQRRQEKFAQEQDFLVQKRANAELSLATNTDNVEVIDAPKKTGYRPVEPNPTLAFSIAFVIGLIIPFSLVLIKDLSNNNITDKDELEKQVKVPLLGMIANGPKEAKLVARTLPNSAIAESFKFARINLQYFHQENNEQVIGVTSSISGEGKTFCSANLSTAFAESGKRTLLIGGDLRKPRIQDFFDLSGPGLSDYLSGSVSIDDIVQPTEFRKLDVIAPGIPQEDPINLFESARMEELIRCLRDRYDYVIIETPPIGYVADYFVMLKHFDISLFVVRYNYTNKNILGGINDLYAKNKIKNLYLLFNDVKFSAEYGYGYLSNSDGYYTQQSKKRLTGKPNKTKNPFS